MVAEHEAVAAIARDPAQAAWHEHTEDFDFTIANFTLQELGDAEGVHRAVAYLQKRYRGARRHGQQGDEKLAAHLRRAAGSVPHANAQDLAGRAGGSAPRKGV